VEGGPYLRYNDAPINKWYYQNEDLSIYSSGSGKCVSMFCVFVFVICGKGGFIGWFVCVRLSCLESWSCYNM